MSEARPNKARLAVIGVGNMGSSHTRDIVAMKDAELVAVCDIDHARADHIAAQYGVKAYYDYKTLLAEAELDGVVVSTPHYSHKPISIAALEKGVHVLVEKPIAVHTADANDMIAAYEQARATYPNLLFAIVFMQRTYGYWLKIKELIDSGELGQLVRTSWIITDWFRTQAYYDGGGWRATWEGEGGGVLTNQCSHNLDMYQWLVGMPKRIRGFISRGKYHTVEVEDEVTAYFEHENGMIGHLITATGETPGTNRLEIVGEYGKLIYEDGNLTFHRNRRSMLDQIRDAPTAYERVENWKIDVPYQHHGLPGHSIIIENFADAILNGTPLIATAPEGLHSVAINNAIMLSSFENRMIELPLDDDVYKARLEQLIADSQTEKTVCQESKSGEQHDSLLKSLN